MKRFIGKVAVFVGIHLVFLAVVFSAYLNRFPPREGYHMASLDKHSLLLTQASPRLIFIGGSSMALGIDSGLVASRCRLNPVNMGLHMGNGFEFMLQEALPFVRREDVIVVSPEYHAFERYYRARPEFIARLVECRPSSIRVLTRQQRKELFDYGIAHHVGRIVRTMSGQHEQVFDQGRGIYKRSAFNLNGDFVAHHGVHARRGAAVRLDFSASTTPDVAVEHLNRFHSDCQAKGVRVFFSHPPYDTRYFEKYREPILYLERLLQEKLSVPMLDTAEEMAFPSENFFDTEYHLTFAGKTKRSELLAARLAEALRGATAPRKPPGR